MCKVLWAKTDWRVTFELFFWDGTWIENIPESEYIVKNIKIIETSNIFIGAKVDINCTYLSSGLARPYLPVEIPLALPTRPTAWICWTLKN